MIRLFSDPHFGRTPSSNASRQSKANLREQLVKYTGMAVDGEFDQAYCLGDLFDKPANAEIDILEGLKIAANCDVILCGNHDILNREGTYSSFQLLADAYAGAGSFLMSPDPGRPFSTSFELDRSWLFFVPHCYTQEIFEASVREAVAEARMRKEQTGFRAYLGLHCCLNSYGATEKEGSSLYLTEELKKEVKEAFTWTFLGHEHLPAREDNIVVLGNIYPLTFGEIGDRYFYDLDPATGTLDQRLLLPAETMYEELEVGELKGRPRTDRTMVKIVGKLDYSEVGAKSKALAQLWQDNPHLIGVKDEVEIILPDQAVKEGFSLANYLESLKDQAAEAGWGEALEMLLGEDDE